MKQSEPPEAIILTMPVGFFLDRAGNPSTYRVKTDTNPGYTYNKNLFIANCMERISDLFERYMQKEDSLWNYRKTQLPTEEVAWVYLVWAGKIQFRLNFVQYERGVAKVFDDSW